MASRKRTAFSRPLVLLLALLAGSLGTGCGSAPERDPLTEEEKASLGPMWQEFVERKRTWRTTRARWLAMNEAARNTLVENMIRYMSDRYHENDLVEAKRAAAELILYDRGSLEYLGAIMTSEKNAMGLREMAAGCLVRIGTPAVPALKESLTASRYRARRLAVRALGRIRERSSIPAIVERLEEDENFVVRAEAATALGGFPGEREAETALVAHVEDEDPIVAEAVARSLGRLRSFRAVPRLVRRLAAAERGTSMKLPKAIRWALGRITSLDPASPIAAFERWRPPAGSGATGGRAGRS